jgi:hypothetical protein
MLFRKKAALLALLLSSAFTFAQNIPATDASKHIGEHGIVCGTIAGTHTASSARGTPTFIDFEKPYPSQSFTAVIWQKDKAIPLHRLRQFRGRLHNHERQRRPNSFASSSLFLWRDFRRNPTLES